MKEDKEEMCVIDVDMDDDTFMRIAVMAHERDITFNQMVTIILKKQLKRLNDEETSEG